MKKVRFVPFNANPWGIEVTGDCLVRAIYSASLYGYSYIAKLLGEEVVPGFGVHAKKGMSNLDKFAKKTGIIAEYRLPEITDELAPEDDPDSDMVIYNKACYNKVSVEQWLSMLPDGPNKRFIFICRPSPDDKSEATDKVGEGEMHAVYGNLAKREYYDTFDSGDFLVEKAYVVKKICPKDDPNYYANEFKRLKAEKTA